MIELYKRAHYFILFLFAFNVSVLATQNNVTDNLSIFKNLVNTSLPVYLDLIKDNQGFQYNIQSPDNFKWIFEDQLSSYAKKNNIKNVFNSSSSQKLPIVNIELLKYLVDYQDNSVLPGKNLIRKISLDYHIKITLSDKKLLISEHYTNTFQDTVKSNHLKLIENPNFAFTIGPKNERFNKFFEPLLVISITGTIIYIFYAFRSK